MSFAIRNVLNVFLASPSDLVDERKITRQAIERLNNLIGREIGWHIELYGWEDTLPGVGRPQAIINEDVDICDLFIGILWKRWGQSTGVYSSGFEEEFERAQARYEKSQQPEMWLFFRDVDDDLLQDPGDQLKRVMKFKNRQTELKKYFFKNYADPHYFKDLIEGIIIKYLISKSKVSGIATTQPGESSEVSHRASSTGGSITSESTPAQNRFPTNILNKFAEQLKKRSLGFSYNSPDSISDIEVARFHLTATAIISQNLFNNLLGPHEINFLYTRRRDIELIPVETLLIIKTLVAKSGDNVAGWFWLKNYSKKQLDDLFEHLSTQEHDASIREQTLGFLSSHGIIVGSSKPQRRRFFTRLLQDASDKVRIAAVKYIGEIGNTEDIRSINKYIHAEKAGISKEALTRVRQW